ncbi:MAG: hypothetical protein E6R08_00595 [Nevskiaceae bacterium]|nr:MAG: hypothetical protein E6R08_00595 [Nevskiaceae bacterium]
MLKPSTRQAALDTARGMKLPELAVWYGLCTQPDRPCCECPLEQHKRSAWQPSFRVREISDGRLALHAGLSTEMSSEAASWAELVQRWDVPKLRRQTSQEGGFEWVAAEP